MGGSFELSTFTRNWTITTFSVIHISVKISIYNWHLNSLYNHVEITLFFVYLCVFCDFSLEWVSFTLNAARSLNLYQTLKRAPPALFQQHNKPEGQHLTTINKVREYLPISGWQTHFTCHHNSTTGLNLTVRSHLQRHLFARSLCNNTRKQEA